MQQTKLQLLEEVRRLERKAGEIQGIAEDNKAKLENCQEENAQLREALAAKGDLASDIENLNASTISSGSRLARNSWLQLVGLVLIVLGFVFIVVSIHDQKRAISKSLDIASAVASNMTAPTPCPSALPPPIKFEPLPEQPLRHIVRTTLNDGPKCWLRFTVDDKIILEGYQKPSTYTTGGNRINVRSGCPGRLHYEMDGMEASPENKAHNPSVVEVVDLP